MAKCAICGQTVYGGDVVDRECLDMMRQHCKSYSIQVGDLREKLSAKEAELAAALSAGNIFKMDNDRLNEALEAMTKDLQFRVKQVRELQDEVGVCNIVISDFKRRLGDG